MVREREFLVGWFLEALVSQDPDQLATTQKSNLAAAHRGKMLIVRVLLVRLLIYCVPAANEAATMRFNTMWKTKQKYAIILNALCSAMAWCTVHIGLYSHPNSISL